MGPRFLTVTSPQSGNGWEIRSATSALVSAKVSASEAAVLSGIDRETLSLREQRGFSRPQQGSRFAH
jgi:hypothetical protein